MRASSGVPASRSPSRPELAGPRPRGDGGARSTGATAARPPEADAFEKEYPGASWLASRALRQLEVVGGKAEALISDVARRHGLSHAALNALAVIEGAGGPIPTGEVSARMLPDVQQVANTVMGVFDDKTLLALLSTLAAISASVDNVPEELPAPAPRRRPTRLRRPGTREEGERGSELARHECSRAESGIGDFGQC